MEAKMTVKNPTLALQAANQSRRRQSANDMGTGKSFTAKETQDRFAQLSDAEKEVLEQTIG
jgi:hypothetical protein